MSAALSVGEIMPLSIPVSKDELAEATWEYAIRKLTSLSDPADIIKFLGKGTGTEVPANKSLYDLIAIDRLDDATYGLNTLRSRILERLSEADFETRLSATRAARIDLLEDATYGLDQLLRTAHFDLTELPLKFVSSEVLNDIVAIGPTNTTELSITVTLPTGAVIRRAMLAAFITVMNNSANAHKIDIDVQGRVSGGSWSTFFSEDDVIGVPNIDGATTAIVALQDVSLVNAAGIYGFRLAVTQSSANSVRYTTQYLLIVTYRMT